MFTFGKVYICFPSELGKNERGLALVRLGIVDKISLHESLMKSGTQSSRKYGPWSARKYEPWSSRKYVQSPKGTKKKGIWMTLQ